MRPLFFYGWVLVAITVIDMTLVYGIRHSFAVFFPFILDEFGWGRGSTAVMLSLNILIYGLMAPVAGSLCDRWKPRRVMLVGITILGIATASNAFANELWHFYMLFGVLMPIGSALSGWPILGPTIVNWFVKKRGLAIGLGQMGGGLSFVYGLVAELAISWLGWRHAYFLLAGILVSALLPLAFLFFYYRPEDRGLRAYGTASPSRASPSAAVPAAVGNPTHQDWTLGRAMRTRQLWLAVVSYLLFWGLAAYMVLAHQVKFAEDVGYSSTFGAAVFALFGVAMAVGQFSGFISDWIGRERTITLSAILVIVAVGALLLVKDTSQPWLLYLHAIFFGLGVGLFSPTSMAGMADIFHGRHFGAIAGLLLTGMGIGGAIGPWLGGYLYDTFGSYAGAFALSMAAAGFSCIFFWMAAPRKAAALRAGP